MEKEWRFSREEYYEILNKWMDERIIYIDKHFKEFTKNLDTKSKALFTVALDKSKSLINSSFVSSAVKEKMKFIVGDVDYWAETSINPSSLKEIMARIIANQMYGVNCICMTYVLNSELINSEEILDDICFLESGFFKFSIWDDKHVNAFINMMVNFRNKDKKVKTKYNKEFIEVFNNLSESKYKKFNPSANCIDWIQIINSPWYSTSSKYEKYIDDNKIIPEYKKERAYTNLFTPGYKEYWNLTL